MTETRIWKVLFVDDDPDFRDQVKEYLDGENVGASDEQMSVKTLTDFDKALETLQQHRFDLLILDVRLGPLYSDWTEEEVGIRTLEMIQEKRFIPVIFYTALPNRVQHLETSVIQVVEKTEDSAHLLAAVRKIFAAHLPAVNRSLIEHLEIVQRDYMWDFVAERGEQLLDTLDRTDLVYVLARRLAMSLSDRRIRQLAQDFEDSAGTSTAEDRVHPIQYYVMPPVEQLPLTGDLYQGDIGGQDGYWVLLTPSCDFVARRNRARPANAERVLMAHCALLTEQEEYRDWVANCSSGKLKSLLKNHRQGRQAERFYFLPGALDLPDLVVDFQQLVTLPRAKMDDLNQLASLDSPFAEALLACFSRYFGRLGTPDLDIDIIVNKLQTSM